MIPFLLLAATLPMYAETIQAFGFTWDQPVQGKYAVVQEEGVEVLKMTEGGPRDPVPRRPGAYIVAQSKPFKKVTIDLEMKPDGRSLIIVYGWQDVAHYNYAHISSDTAAKQIVHNGMFHVYGNERVRISSKEGPYSLPEPKWTKVRFVHDGATGKAWVEVDGRKNPSLVAYDLSLTEGRVGFGSFNETGSFRNVRIRGE